MNDSPNASPLTSRLDSFAPPAASKLAEPSVQHNPFPHEPLEPRAVPAHRQNRAYENRVESVDLQPKIALSPTPNPGISAHPALPARQAAA
jgi:hypothetical protein